MTEQPVVVACSDLPLLSHCGNSWSPPAPRKPATSGPAKLGTDVHDLLRRHVMGEDVEEPEDGELARLFAYGCKTWERMKHEFPDPQTEAYNDYLGKGWLLTGHVDLFSLGNVLDHKSGRKENDYTAQVRGYGLLFGAQHGAINWLRDQKVETFDVSDHAAIEAEIDAIVASIGGQSKAGPHCLDFYCKHIGGCAEYIKWAVSMVSPFLPAVQKPAYGGMKAQGPPDLPTTDAQCWDFYDRSRYAAQMIARGDVLLKSRLQANGPMRSADGRVMTYDEESVAGPIDPGKAWPYLVRDFAQEQMATFTTIGKKKLEVAVKKQGEKGKAWFAFKDELREAGAMPDETKRRLKVRKVE